MTIETSENSVAREAPAGIALFENAAWRVRKEGKSLPTATCEAPRVLLFATGWATDERLFAPWAKRLEALNYPAALVILSNPLAGRTADAFLEAARPQAHSTTDAPDSLFRPDWPLFRELSPELDELRRDVPEAQWTLAGWSFGVRFVLDLWRARERIFGNGLPNADTFERLVFAAGSLTPVGRTGIPEAVAKLTLSTLSAESLSTFFVRVTEGRGAWNDVVTNPDFPGFTAEDRPDVPKAAEELRAFAGLRDPLPELAREAASFPGEIRVVIPKRDRIVPVAAQERSAKALCEASLAAGRAEPRILRTDEPHGTFEGLTAAVFDAAFGSVESPIR